MEAAAFDIWKKEFTKLSKLFFILYGFRFSLLVKSPFDRRTIE